MLKPRHNNLNIYNQDANRLQEEREVAELDKKFSVDPSDYNILTHQEDNEGRRMEANEVMSKYLTETARLIESYEQKDIDHVVYLDKSARPVAHIVQLLHKDLASEGAKKPDFNYLNIDRVDIYNYFGIKNWGGSTDDGRTLKESDFVEVIKKPENEEKLTTLLTSIRTNYIVGDIDPNENIVDQVWGLPTKLDGKNVCVVDETMRSGSTLAMAQILHQMAIPMVGEVSGEYFWTPDFKDQVSIGGGQQEIQQGSVPIWYDSKRTDGRGIGDRSDRYYDVKYENRKDQRSLKQKIGSMVLSAPRYTMASPNEEDKLFNYKKDQRFVDLAHDFKQLRSDYRDGKVLFIPPINYSDEKKIQAFEKQGLNYEVDEDDGEVYIKELNILRRVRKNRRIK